MPRDQLRSVGFIAVVLKRLLDLFIRLPFKRAGGAASGQVLGRAGQNQIAQGRVTIGHSGLQEGLITPHPVYPLLRVTVVGSEAGEKHEAGCEDAEILAD